MVKQSLQQSLQQKLSPQQIQLMKLIELSTLELEQKVKDEIETNPALDDTNNSIDSLDEEISDNATLEENQDIDIDQYLSDDEIPAYKLHYNNASQDDVHENAPIVGGQTHFDVLKAQLGEVKLKEEEYKIGEYLIWKFWDFALGLWG